MSKSTVILTIPGLGQAVEVTVNHADANPQQIAATAFMALRFAEFTTDGQTFSARDCAEYLGVNL